jgi:predicted aspartyl protease
VQVATASGRIEAPVVALDSIDIAGARVERAEVVVLPLDEVQGASGLIGLDFLQHFHVSIDTQRGVLRLSAKQ